MVEQSNGKSSQADQIPSADYRRGRRGTFLIALVAVALVAGVTGNLLSKAFGQGDSWHRISWHDGGVFGGPLSPAQIDDRIDRMTKHMAIEIDATARSEEHTSELQSQSNLVCRLLLEKKKK